MKKGGQTALEYMLIIVVGIATVLAIYTWLMGTVEAVQGAASSGLDVLFGTI